MLHLVLDLGQIASQSRIGELGQAYFPSVAPSSKGQDVYISVESPEYESLRDQKIHLNRAASTLKCEEGAASPVRVQDVR